VAAAIAVLAAIGIHRYLRIATSDALLPGLISTQRLTTFYWGQDRLASIVPALTTPIGDEIVNARVQALILALAFFGLLAAFVWHHLRSTIERPSPGAAVVATVVSGLLVIAPLGRLAGYTFVVEQPYAASMLLMLVGTWLIVGGARLTTVACGGGLLLGATALNPTSILLVPFALLLTDDPRRRLRRLGCVAAVALASFALVSALSRTVGDENPNAAAYLDFSVHGTLDGLEPSYRMVSGSVSTTIAAALVAACLLVGALRFGSWSRRLMILYVMAPCFAAVHFLVFAGNRWVELNLYYFRYFFPLYATFMLAVAIAVTEATVAGEGIVRRRLADHPRRFRLGTTAWWPALALAGAATAVFTTARTPIAAIDAAVPAADLARELDVQLVIGDYWLTWPVVMAGRADGADLLGVTGRSTAIEGEIMDVVGDSSESAPLRVLCMGRDAPSCAADLAMFTDRTWEPDEVVSADPLVIDLVPIGHS
jgi:hypothetical protein